MKGNGKIWIFYDTVDKKQSKPLSTLHAQMTLLGMKKSGMQHILIWTPGWTKWVPVNEFLDSDQKFFVIAPAPIPVPGAPIEKHKADKFDKTVKIELAGHEDTITHIMSPDVDDEDESEQYTEILNDSPAGPKSTKKDYGYYHEDFRAENIDPDATFKPSMRLPNKGKDGKPGSERRMVPRHDFKIEVILINKNGRTFRTNSLNISIGGTLLQDELPKDFMNAPFDLILINKFEKDKIKGRLHFQGKIVGDYLDPRRLMFLDTDEHTLKRLDALMKSYLLHQKPVKKKKVG